MNPAKAGKCGFHLLQKQRMRERLPTTGSSRGVDIVEFLSGNFVGSKVE